MTLNGVVATEFGSFWGYNYVKVAEDRPILSATEM